MSFGAMSDSASQPSTPVATMSMPGLSARSEIGSFGLASRAAGVGPCTVKRTLQQAGQFQCIGCKRSHPISEMSGRKNFCRLDSAAYKALTDRWAKSGKSKVRWQGTSEAEKTAWYIESQTAAKGGKRRFDSIIHEDASVQHAVASEFEADRHIPWRMFHIYWKMEGKETISLEREFADIVENNKVHYKRSRNQWLVPWFDGIELKKGSQDIQESAQKRQTMIDDPEDLVGLAAGGKQLRAQFLLQSIVNEQDAPDDLPQVDAHTSDQPPPPAVQDIMARAVHREACVFRRAHCTIFIVLKSFPVLCLRVSVGSSV